MRGSGGTEGGIGMFIAGFALAAGSLWFFFDSVLVTSGGVGWITSQLAAIRGQSATIGPWQTASMGIIFIPFVCGVIALFVDSSKPWAWYLTYFGIFVLVVEILSRLQFVFSMKTSHLMLMLGAFAAGTGMMFRSYRNMPKISDVPNEPSQQKPDKSK